MPLTNQFKNYLLVQIFRPTNDKHTLVRYIKKISIFPEQYKKQTS